MDSRKLDAVQRGNSTSAAEFPSLSYSDWEGFPIVAMTLYAGSFADVHLAGETSGDCPSLRSRALVDGPMFTLARVYRRYVACVATGTHRARPTIFPLVELLVAAHLIADDAADHAPADGTAYVIGDRSAGSRTDPGADDGVFLAGRHAAAGRQARGEQCAD